MAGDGEVAEAARALDRFARDVLRLSAVPRAAGDIAFLHEGGAPGAATRAYAECLARLERAGLVARDTRGLWVQTEAGGRALAWATEWEAVVGDDGTCAVRHGVVFAGDHFLVNGARLSRVVAVEPAGGSAVRIVADGELRPGDVLAGHVPMVG